MRNLLPTTSVMLLCLWGCATPHASPHGDQWDRLYLKGTGFNTNPNSLLVEAVKDRKPGKALDVGMGQGRNSVFLAKAGWDVTGFDLSQEGVAIANRTAEAAGVRLDARVADVDAWDFGVNRWDLIALVYMGGADLAPAIQRALRPGGIVVVEFFHKDMEAEFHHSMGAFETGELERLFPELRVLHSEVVNERADFAGQSMAKLVRFVAEKP